MKGKGNNNGSPQIIFCKSGKWTKVLSVRGWIDITYTARMLSSIKGKAKKDPTIGFKNEWNFEERTELEHSKLNVNSEFYIKPEFDTDVEISN